MKTYNISQLKSHLSQAISMVKEGNPVLVLDRETPVASLVPVDDNADALKIQHPTRKANPKTFYTGVHLDVDIQNILQEDRKSR